MLALGLTEIGDGDLTGLLGCSWTITPGVGEYSILDPVLLSVLI